MNIIKHTPTLKGKDAIRFMKNIENPKPVSAEALEKIRQGANKLERLKK